MASKAPLEAIPLRTLQRFHHATLNTFGDGETLVEAIQRRPGIYGPNPIAYLSLMARRPTLTLGDLEEALMNDRSLVRAGCFRNSVFLVATEDYPLYFRAMYESLAGSGMSRLRSAGYDEQALQGFARRLRESPEFDRPQSQSQLADILFPAKMKRPEIDAERLLFRKLCDIGVLLRTSSKGWKGNQFNYALAERWLDGVTLTHEHPEPARVELVRRYLRTYGPARIEDAVWWTGLSHTDVRRIIEGLGREVIKFPVDGLGEGLLALRETVDAVRKNQGQAANSRILFLPLWDTYPLGWRDRTRVVDTSFAPWVYDPAGNTSSVIVEAGRVIGVWQFRDGDSITLEFHVFEPYANRLNALRLAAEDHAAALAVVAGARDVRVVERALPRPLSERATASFLWPLGKEPVFRMTEQVFIENPMDRRSGNVLRSKFLDDERLVRPADLEPTGRPVPRDDGTLEDELTDGAPSSTEGARTSSSSEAEDEPVAKKAPKKTASKKTAAAKKSAPKKKTSAASGAKKPAAGKSTAKKTAQKAKKAPKRK